MSGEVDGTRPSDEVGKKFVTALGEVTEKITKFVSHENYGSEVDELFVAPIIIKQSEERESAGWYKERKLFKRKTRSSDFRLRINYDEFCQATDEKRIKLIVRNIIDSVRILSVRAKRDFDGARLESDILGLFGFGYEDL
jgi:methyl coenzyme M reductase subunit C-like uncharacterized protein (methanogenesis marker protein 7)